MNVIRQTERKKIINTVVTVAGTGGITTTDFVIPDGMVAEIIEIQVTHDSSDAVGIDLLVIDRTPQTTMRVSTLAAGAGYYATWPRQQSGGTSDLLVDQRNVGVPVPIPSGDAFRVYSGATLGQGETLTIRLNYVLKPYSFNRDNSPAV